MRLYAKLDTIGPLIPNRETMVETERHLSSLVHGHLVLILASELSESAYSLVDPLITVDLLTAAWRSRSTGGG